MQKAEYQAVLELNKAQFDSAKIVLAHEGKMKLIAKLGIPDEDGVVKFWRGEIALDSVG